MNAPISNPADCEVRGVIRFLQAENVRPSEIHRRLVAVYGEHVRIRYVREKSKLCRSQFLPQLFQVVSLHDIFQSPV